MGTRTCGILVVVVAAATWTVAAAAVSPEGSGLEVRASSSTLLEAAVVALVSACISSYITSRILLARTADLTKLIEELKRQGDAHGKEITKLALDLSTEDRNRLACELRCHRIFSTHVEVDHVISENAAQAESMSTKLGVVHGRVDDLVRALGELTGYLKARDRVPSVPSLLTEGEHP